MINLPMADDDEPPPCCGPCQLAERRHTQAGRRRRPAYLPAGPAEKTGRRRHTHTLDSCKREHAEHASLSSSSSNETIDACALLKILNAAALSGRLDAGRSGRSLLIKQQLRPARWPSGRERGSTRCSPLSSQPVAEQDGIINDRRRRLVCRPGRQALACASVIYCIFAGHARASVCAIIETLEPASEPSLQSRLLSITGQPAGFGRPLASAHDLIHSLFNIDRSQSINFLDLVCSKREQYGTHTHAHAHAHAHTEDNNRRNKKGATGIHSPIRRLMSYGGRHGSSSCCVTGRPAGCGEATTAI
jgi:hypothetical protein